MEHFTGLCKSEFKSSTFKTESNVQCTPNTLLCIIIKTQKKAHTDRRVFAFFAFPCTFRSTSHNCRTSSARISMSGTTRRRQTTLFNKESIPEKMQKKWYLKSFNVLSDIKCKLQNTS